MFKCISSRESGFVLAQAAREWCLLACRVKCGVGTPLRLPHILAILPFAVKGKGSPSTFAPRQQLRTSELVSIKHLTLPTLRSPSRGYSVVRNQQRSLRLAELLNDGRQGSSEPPPTLRQCSPTQPRRLLLPVLVRSMKSSNLLRCAQGPSVMNIV